MPLTATKHIRIFFLATGLLTVFGPHASASSPFEQVKKCIGGNAIDAECMRKHRSQFEEYVIARKDYLSSKRAVADALVRYYQIVSAPATEQSRQVIAKQSAYQALLEIFMQVRKDHGHLCTVSPDCPDGVFWDIGRDEIDQEVNIRSKQYLANLDEALFLPELKWIELDIEGKGHGPGFWSQLGSGLLEGAADGLSK